MCLRVSVSQRQVDAQGSGLDSVTKAALADPSTPAVPQVLHPAAKPCLLSADTALLQF